MLERADLRQLATFAAVVERGSFSAAAEALGVTQPAVSQAVRSLERAAGGALLDRSRRRPRLTERGEIVHRHALRLLAEAEELGRELAAGDGALSGRLVVAASTGPGEHILPALLAGFRRQHPAVAVALRVEDTRTVTELVLEREVELGIVGARRPHRALVYEPFLHDRVVLAVPPGHPFAGRTVSLDELLGETLIVMQEGAGIRSVIEQELRDAGVRLRDVDVTLELGLQESAKSAVEAGYGVSFLSSLAVAKELRLGTLATADVAGIAPARDFYAVRPAAAAPRRLVEAFLAHARGELDDG